LLQGQTLSHHGIAQFAGEEETQRPTMGPFLIEAFGEGSPEASNPKSSTFMQEIHSGNQLSH
jgi:hypothetical protein